MTNTPQEVGDTSERTLNYIGESSQGRYVTDSMMGRLNDMD